MTYGTKNGTGGKSCMPPSKLRSAVPNTRGAMRYYRDKTGVSDVGAGEIKKNYSISQQWMI